MKDLSSSSTRASSSLRAPTPPGPRPPQRRTVVAVVLVVAAGIWFLVNGPVEGPTLVVVTPEHGLTVADLFSLVALAIAAVLLLTSRR